MQELLKSIAAGLVQNPDEITVTVDEPDEEGTVVYHLLQPFCLRQVCLMMGYF